MLNSLRADHMKHREKPLAEVTLRKYEKPYRLTGRELVKKLCLSMGLLQPADGRDVIVDVFQVIVDNKALSSDDIVEKVVASRKKEKLELIGVAPSNIRRQIKRLKDLFLIEKVGNVYRVSENARLVEVFEEKIEKFLLTSITDRVKEYLQALEPKR